MTSRSESDPLPSLLVFFTGDLSGVWLRFTSDELWRAFAELSESTDLDRLRLSFLSSSSSSSDDEDRPLLAGLLWGDADDEELCDELLDLDFFLFLSGDFSDAEELSLFAGEADRLIGDASSSRALFWVGMRSDTKTN